MPGLFQVDPVSTRHLSDQNKSLAIDRFEKFNVPNFVSQISNGDTRTSNRPGTQEYLVCCGVCSSTPHSLTLTLFIPTSLSMVALRAFPGAKIVAGSLI